MLASIEGLSREVLDGEGHLGGALRLEGEGLLEALGEHMSWEEQHLVPALRASDAWGDARVERLFADHREQRGLLEHALARLRDPTRPAVLIARNLLDLVSLLRHDMKDEESCALGEDLLRDDATAVDAESG
jgi:hypothetical protein